LKKWNQRKELTQNIKPAKHIARRGFYFSFVVGSVSGLNDIKKIQACRLPLLSG